MNTTKSKNTEALFLNYDWPGNVRELKNAIERSMIFETGSVISTDHLPIMEKAPGPVPHAGISFSGNQIIPLADMEKRMLEKALEKTDGNKSKAARLLKITRDTLRYKVKKYRLS